MKIYCSMCKHYPVHYEKGRPIKALEAGAPLLCYGEQAETPAEWLGAGTIRITPLLFCVAENSRNECSKFSAR